MLIEEEEAGKRGSSLSSGIGLNESNKDARKDAAGTKERVLQTDYGTAETVQGPEDVAGQ